MIIFLDNAGVPHADALYLQAHRPVLLAAEGALFMWASILVDKRNDGHG